MKNKFSFGLKMWALRKARELIKKEQAEIESKNQPITPLDAHVEHHLKVPIEATAPVADTMVVIKDPTPMERAIQHLREQASKL